MPIRKRSGNLFNDPRRFFLGFFQCVLLLLMCSIGTVKRLEEIPFYFIGWTGLPHDRLPANSIIHFCLAYVEITFGRLDVIAVNWLTDWCLFFCIHVEVRQVYLQVIGRLRLRLS